VSLRGLAGDALEAESGACHQRSAGRLQRLCFANGGVYIKLGQHIAQLVRPPPPAMPGLDRPALPRHPGRAPEVIGVYTKLGQHIAQLARPSQ